MMGRYSYQPAGQIQFSGQPAATAVVTAMELVVAAIVVVGLAVAYEYSQRGKRR